MPGQLSQKRGLFQPLGTSSLALGFGFVHSHSSGDPTDRVESQQVRLWMSLATVWDLRVVGYVSVWMLVPSSKHGYIKRSLQGA